MTPEEHTQAIGGLRDDLSAIAQALAEIRGTLNDGLKLMVAEHKVELATIKSDVATINQSVVNTPRKARPRKRSWRRGIRGCKQLEGQDSTGAQHPDPRRII